MRRHLRLADKGRQQVTFQVVDGQKRPLRRAGQGLGGGATDEQRRGQARTRGRGKRIDIPYPHGGQPQRLLDEGMQVERMVARGELGHHAAELPVEFDL